MRLTHVGRVAWALGFVGLLGAAGVAHADATDPCADAVLDPVATPVRDVAVDAQQAACTRDELSTHLLAHALIDTPGFYGVLGAAWQIAGRTRLGRRFELDASLRITSFTFVQNAVNKVTELALGPATVGGVWAGALGTGARIGLAATLELPFTRDELDTLHTSGAVTALVSASLAPRTALHARLGVVAMLASSAGGTTDRLGLRAGLDLAHRLRRAIALQLGAEVQAGWYGGLDHVLVRAGVSGRLRGPWRGAVGLGIPVPGLGGAERTDLVVDLGIIRDLR